MKKRIKAKNAPPLKTRRTLRLLSLLLCVLCGGEFPRAQEKGPIVFVGSSIFHRWTQLTSQMAPLPVTNIAFGGGGPGGWNPLVGRPRVSAKAEIRRLLLGQNRRRRGDSAS